MSDWIELNLPYYKSEYFDSTDIKYPKLDKRAKKELGFNRKELDAIYDKIPKFMDVSYKKFEKALSNFDKKLSADLPQREEGWEKERAKRLLASSNKDLKVLGAYIEKKFQIEDWEGKQPDMIAYHKEFSEKSTAFHDNVKKQSFSGLGLDKPGTLIEVKVGEEVNQYLIGHINPNCGVCDDCVQFDNRTAIVLRYKVVWSDETA